LREESSSGQYTHTHTKRERERERAKEKEREREREIAFFRGKKKEIVRNKFSLAIKHGGWKWLLARIRLLGML